MEEKKLGRDIVMTEKDTSNVTLPFGFQENLKNLQLKKIFIFHMMLLKVS